MQFTFEIYAAATNCKKSNTLKPLPGILEDHGNSRSLMFTSIKSSSLLFVMISSMSVPFCNPFHATRALLGGGGSSLWRPPTSAFLNLQGRDLNC